MNTLSPYIFPPALSLLCGLCLAVLVLAKGALKKERLLFALVSVWYCLPSPLFIMHHVIADHDQLMSIERGVHFFYVYLPFILVLFFHTILNITDKKIVWASLGLSFLISLTTQSDQYFSGFNHFAWGYIAKGGPAFLLFTVYGTVILFHSLSCFHKRLKVEHNPHLRLKYKYMIFGFGSTGVLSLFNVPAVNGIDFYPIGNLSFIPLIFMAYGLLKHELMEFSGLFYVGVTRAMLFILVVVPNLAILVWARPHVKNQSDTMLFLMLALWLLLAYFYTTRTKAFLEHWLFQARRDLQRIQSELTREMLELRDVEALAAKVAEVMRTALSMAWAELLIYEESNQSLVNSQGLSFLVPETMITQLPDGAQMVDLPLLKSISSSTPAMHLLSAINAEYGVVLAHNRNLIGLLALPSKENGGRLDPYETDFILRIADPLNLALANAIMYQRITTLKDNLQDRTTSLTQEIIERRRTEESLTEAKIELQQANASLEKAVLHANEMASQAEITNYVLTLGMEERKKIEAALRKSEERYRLIAENASAVIWTIDRHSKLTYMSPSIDHLLGYTVLEVAQMKWPRLLVTESLKRLRRVLGEVLGQTTGIDLETAEGRTLEVELRHKNGTTVWAEVNMRLFQDSTGKTAGVLGVARNIDRRRAYERDLLHRAFHDSLSGLHNRQGFMERLEKEIGYAQRDASGLTLLFFDLNKFKTVNDRYGHETGDHLLKDVANRLKRSLRETDLVARLGGDEFTVLLRNPDKVSPDQVMQRISRDLKDPYHINGVCIDFVSASIGIARFPTDGDTIDALIRSADSAMYEAKRQEKDYIYFSRQMAMHGDFPIAVPA